jgi:hypothetical protein
MKWETFDGQEIFPTPQQENVLRELPFINNFDSGNNDYSKIVEQSNGVITVHCFFQTF